jgi:hypothetical protein
MERITPTLRLLLFLIIGIEGSQAQITGGHKTKGDYIREYRDAEVDTILEDAPGADLIQGRLSMVLPYGGYYRGGGGLELDLSGRTAHLYLRGGGNISFWRNLVEQPKNLYATAEGGQGASKALYGIVGYALYQGRSKEVLHIPLVKKPNYEIVKEVEGKMSERVNIEAGFESVTDPYNIKGVNIEDFDQGGQKMLTMFSYNAFRFGMAFHRTFNTKVRFDKDIGRRSLKNKQRVYGHVLLPLSQKASPMEKSPEAEPNSGPGVPERLMQRTEMRSLGYRLGFEYDLFNPFYYQHGIHVGIFPGFKGSGFQNAFFQYSIGIGFVNFADG